jgi:uncharacterized membrane protein YfcA
LGTLLAVLLAYLLALYPATVFALEAMNAHFAKLSYERKHGHLYHGLLLVALAIFFAVVGISILVAVMAPANVVGLIVGSLLSFAGMYLYRTRKKARRGIRYYLFVIACLIAGLAILVVSV